MVFTSIEATLSALKEAANLASSLGGRITLIVPQIVPYPLPLASPPVLIDFSERRLRVIASNSRVETRVSIYLCRHPLETLRSVLKPHSLVVIGSRKSWWPTAEKRLAAKLRRFGHEVIVTEREINRHARSVLHRNWRAVFVRLLGLHQSLRQALGIIGENIMDYIIAGIASLGLFVYLRLRAASSGEVLSE